MNAYFPGGSGGAIWRGSSGSVQGSRRDLDREVAAVAALSVLVLSEALALSSFIINGGTRDEINIKVSVDFVFNSPS